MVTTIAVAGVLNQSYTHSFAFDSADRVATLMYPDATFTQSYSAQGHRTKVINPAGNVVLEEIKATDAFGSPTEESFYNGLHQTSYLRDAATGRLTKIQSGTPANPKSIQDLEYAWRTNSTLYTRMDHKNTPATVLDDPTDLFYYDPMERLTQQSTIVGASRKLCFNYDTYGNLTTQQSGASCSVAVTSATFGVPGQPHRMASATIRGIANGLTYDNNGNITTYDASSGNDTFIAYDGQNNVTKITVGADKDTTSPTARDEFWYDPDGARFLGRETWDAAGAQKTAITTYIGNFEEVLPAAGGAYAKIQRYQLTDTVLYDRLTAAVGGALTGGFYFLHRDHLGSVDVVSDANGFVYNKTSFDPFGGRRDALWNQDCSASIWMRRQRQSG